MQQACQQEGVTRWNRQWRAVVDKGRSVASQTRLVTPKVWREAALTEKKPQKKNTTHHIPPKQTSRATQNFQLEPQEGTGNGSM